MTLVIIITICALVILLGFEIRHHELVEEVGKLTIKANILDEEVQKLKADVRLKQDVYEDHKPPLTR